MEPDERLQLLRELDPDDMHAVAHLLWAHARDLEQSSAQWLALHLSDALHQAARDVAEHEEDEA